MDYYKIVIVYFLVTTLSGSEVSESWSNTLYKFTLVTVGVWLSMKIKNTIFTRVWDWFWDIVYYQRCQNLDSAKSLKINEERLEEQLTKLRASGHTYPELSEEVDQLTEKSKPTRKGFPDIPFSLLTLGSKLCLYVRQCYASKADKLKLDTCHKEINECLGKLEKQITLQNKADEQIHHPSSDIGFAISPSRDNIPYQITDFTVTPDLGSLKIQWSDGQNDRFDIIRYEIEYNGYIKEVKPPFTKYVALTDRRVTPWMSYTVKIRAITENGLTPGPWSESITVVNGTKPSVPSGLKVVQPTSNTSIKISCRCLKHEEITSCIVSGSRHDEFEVPFTERNGDRGVVELMGLNPNMQYRLSLKFKNSYGISEGCSTELEVSMLDFIPSPPKNLTGLRVLYTPEYKGEKAKVTFSWSKSSCNAQIADKLCYEVEMTKKNRVSWVKIATVNTTTYKLVTDNYHTCCYRVRAITADNCKSDYTQKITIEGANPPKAWTDRELFAILILSLMVAIIDTRILWFFCINSYTIRFSQENYLKAAAIGLTTALFPIGKYYYYGKLTLMNELGILATMITYFTWPFVKKDKYILYETGLTTIITITLLDIKSFWLLFTFSCVRAIVKEEYFRAVISGFIAILFPIGISYYYGGLTIANKVEILTTFVLSVYFVSYKNGYKITN